MCVDFSLMGCKRVGLALPSISFSRGRTFSRMFTRMFARAFSQNGVLGEPTGPICRRFGKFRLFPPGANGRVKTSHGRFNASVLACASRTDLVVRISEGLQIARSRIATYYSEAKRIN